MGDQELQDESISGYRTSMGVDNYSDRGGGGGGGGARARARGGGGGGGLRPIPL